MTHHINSGQFSPISAPLSPVQGTVGRHVVSRVAVGNYSPRKVLRNIDWSLRGGRDMGGWKSHGLSVDEARFLEKLGFRIVPQRPVKRISAGKRPPSPRTSPSPSRPPLPRGPRKSAPLMNIDLINALLQARADIEPFVDKHQAEARRLLGLIGENDEVQKLGIQEGIRLLNFLSKAHVDDATLVNNLLEEKALEGLLSLFKRPDGGLPSLPNHETPDVQLVYTAALLEREGLQYDVAKNKLHAKDKDRYPKRLLNLFNISLTESASSSARLVVLRKILENPNKDKLLQWVGTYPQHLKTLIDLKGPLPSAKIDFLIFLCAANIQPPRLMNLCFREDNLAPLLSPFATPQTDMPLPPSAPPAVQLVYTAALLAREGLQYDVGNSTLTSSDGRFTTITKDKSNDQLKGIIENIQRFQGLGLKVQVKERHLEIFGHSLVYILRGETQTQPLDKLFSLARPDTTLFEVFKEDLTAETERRKFKAIISDTLNQNVHADFIVDTPRQTLILQKEGIILRNPEGEEIGRRSYSPDVQGTIELIYTLFPGIDPSGERERLVEMISLCTTQLTERFKQEYYQPQASQEYTKTFVTLNKRADGNLDISIERIVESGTLILMTPQGASEHHIFNTQTTTKMCLTIDVAKTKAPRDPSTLEPGSYFNPLNYLIGVPTFSMSCTPLSPTSKAPRELMS